MKRWLARVNKPGLAPDAQSGQADPTASGEHPDLLSLPDHKRRGRGAEQQDHGHQTEGFVQGLPSIDFNLTRICEKLYGQKNTNSGNIVHIYATF